MSKEEILKIQSCVLKVNIHCDGCKHEVKKILQKIEGVYTTKIDAEQGKVSVSGTVAPAVLIKKLAKSGKHAELWGAPKANNNNSQMHNLNNQLKNMQIDIGKGGKKGEQKGGNNNQPTGERLNPQQLAQMKAFQDLKLPGQFKDVKMPKPNSNQMAVKFILPEDEDLSDDYDDDDEDYDDDEDDSEFEDEMNHPPLNKMKPMNIGIGQGGKGLNNIMMMNGMNDQHKGGNGGGKKGGSGVPVPVQIMGNGNVGKKGGGNNGGNQNQGGGGGGGGGGNSKNGNGGGNGNSMMMNGIGNKNQHGMPTNMNMVPGSGGNMSQMMNNMSRAQMGGNLNMPQSVQGLPAGVEQQRQQYMAATMNQQRGMANERFQQPMMYAPPPPAVNYMPPYPYPYPPPPQADPYTHYFSDENTSSCNVM